jgi:hemerythrin-like domain-containing protein
MNPLDVLKDEHAQIDMELLELEEVIEGSEINYPNLIHCFKKLCEIWNPHEEKEERVFKVFDKESIKVPVSKMTFEHRELKGPMEKILAAINSGSEFEIRKALRGDLAVLIERIRKHKNDEDEVLYTVAVQEFTPEEWKEINRILI